jgi:hypothetical protein
MSPKDLWPIANGSKGHGGLGVPGEAARLICRQVSNIIGWKMIYNYDGQRKIRKILRSLVRPVSIMAGGRRIVRRVSGTRCSGRYGLRLAELMRWNRCPLVSGGPF